MTEIIATPEQLTEARNWIADCEWGDLDATGVAALPERAVIAGVNHHYEGGWRQFVIDVTPDSQAVHYPLWESMTWLEQQSILAARTEERLTYEAGFYSEGNGAAMNVDFND